MLRPAADLASHALVVGGCFDLLLWENCPKVLISWILGFLCSTEEVAGMETVVRLTLGNGHVYL